MGGSQASPFGIAAHRTTLSVPPHHRCLPGWVQAASTPRTMPRSAQWPTSATARASPALSGRRRRPRGPTGSPRRRREPVNRVSRHRGAGVSLTCVCIHPPPILVRFLPLGYWATGRCDCFALLWRAGVKVEVKVVTQASSGEASSRSSLVRRWRRPSWRPAAAALLLAAASAAALGVT